MDRRVGEDGERSTIALGTIERLAGSTTAENLGVNLQESVVKQQLEDHREKRRKFDGNPLIWLLTINEMKVDVRLLPIEVQEVA